jgi:hypothetical protein
MKLLQIFTLYYTANWLKFKMTFSTETYFKDIKDLSHRYSFIIVSIVKNQNQIWMYRDRKVSLSNEV